MPSFGSTTRNVFPSARKLWSMLPFARIFLVFLIFYWSMCEVCLPQCERVMDFSDLCENIRVNAALCKNISKLATPSDDFPLAE